MAKTNKKQTNTLDRFDPTQDNYETVRIPVRMPAPVKKNLVKVLARNNATLKRKKKKAISMNSLVVHILIEEIKKYVL